MQDMVMCDTCATNHMVKTVLHFNILQAFQFYGEGRPGSEARPFYYLLCENEVLYHLGALFWNAYPSSGVLNIQKLKYIFVEDASFLGCIAHKSFVT